MAYPTRMPSFIVLKGGPAPVSSSSLQFLSSLSQTQVSPPKRVSGCDAQLRVMLLLLPITPSCDAAQNMHRRLRAQTLFPAPFAPDA
eukprot:704874-Pelagomonas_calceolata.AAC.1